MKHRRLGIILVFAALSGCAHSNWGSGDAPPMSDQGWRDFTSEHFILTTEQSDYMAGLLIEELERDLLVLRAVAFPQVELPKKRTRVLLMRGDILRELAGDGQIGGYFRASFDTTEYPDKIVLELPNGGVLGGLQELRETVMHELTHGFVRLAVARAPAWFNEGMACYWESLQLDADNQLIIGRPPTFLGAMVYNWPPLTELIGQDASHFYNRPYRYTAYGAAWGAIHQLYERYPDRLAAYEAALRRGQDERVAWRDTIQLTAQELDAEIHDRFHTDDGIAYRKEGPRLGDLKPATSEPTSSAQVHVHWALIARDQNDRQAASRETKELVTAERLDGNDLYVQVERLYQLRHDHLIEARDGFEKLWHTHPDKSSLLGIWADVSFEIEEARPLAEHDWNALAPRFEELVAKHHTATALRLAAQFELQRQGAAAARPLAEASVALNPICVYCLDTLAQVRHQLNDRAGAIDALERAIAAWPYEGAPTELLKELADARTSPSP